MGACQDRRDWRRGRARDHAGLAAHVSEDVGGLAIHEAARFAEGDRVAHEAVRVCALPDFLERGEGFAVQGSGPLGMKGPVAARARLGAMYFPVTPELPVSPLLFWLALPLPLSLLLSLSTGGMPTQPATTRTAIAVSMDV